MLFLQQYGSHVQFHFLGPDSHVVDRILNTLVVNFQTYSLEEEIQYTFSSYHTHSLISFILKEKMRSLIIVSLLSSGIISQFRLVFILPARFQLWISHINEYGKMT